MCATFKVCIDALYAVLTNVCTFVFVDHFIPLIMAFFPICSCVATLVAMITGYRNILTFFIFHLRHEALVYIPYADTFNSTFAVKR